MPGKARPLPAYEEAGVVGLARQTWRSALRVASLLVGAVIGAGFASGREIVTFFDPLGGRAPLAIAAAVVILAAGGHAVVRVSVRGGALSYGTVFAATAGRVAGPVIDALVTAFLFLTVGVTLAGGAAIVHSRYHVPDPIALALVAAAGCALTYRGAGGLLRAGPLLTPPLILALLAVTLGTLIAAPGNQFAEPPPVALPGHSPSYVPGGTPAALASGALYGAYNLILAVGVFVAGTRYESAAGATLGSLAGAITLGGVAFAVLAACRRGGHEVLASAIPVAQLAVRLGPAGAHAYSLTLLLAVLTTLTAASMAIAERIVTARASGPGAGAGVRSWLAAPAVIGLAAIPAAAGFANLVRLVYPPMGLVGLAWLVTLFCGRGDHGDEA